MTSLDTALAIWSAVGIVALATLGILGASIHRKYRNDELRAWAVEFKPKQQNKPFDARNDLVPSCLVMWRIADGCGFHECANEIEAKQYIQERLREPEMALTPFGIYNLISEARTEVPVIYRAP